MAILSFLAMLRGVSKKHSMLWYLISLGVGVLFGAVLLRNLTAPWVLNDDYNGAFWSQAAHNFFRAGWIASAGVPSPLYFGPLPIPADQFYVHHPTLFPAIFALVLAGLQESEWAARLFPITCTLLSAAGLWWLVCKTSGLRPAALTLLMFVALPMQMHFGRMVNFEAMEMTLFIGGGICFERWRSTEKGGWAASFAVCLLLSMLTDWLGFLLTLIFAAKLFLEPKQRKLSLVLLVIMGVAGTLFLLQIQLANPDAWAELARAFQMRLGSGAIQKTAVTWGEWARTVGGYLVTYFHPLCWGLALTGGGICLWRRVNLTAGQRVLAEISGCLFLMNALYLVGLRNQSYVHDFASFYLSIPLALMAGLALEALIEALGTCQGFAPRLAVPAGVVLAGYILVAGVQQLEGIDSPFGILDDADDEPLQLMTSLGSVIQHKFAPSRPILCNFDEGNSPLAYYSQHPLVTGIHTVEEWNQAIAEMPEAAGDVIWLDGPDATKILSMLPPGKKKEVRIDGVPFCFWTPLHPKSAHGKHT